MPAFENSALGLLDTVGFWSIVNLGLEAQGLSLHERDDTFIVILILTSLALLIVTEDGAEERLVGLCIGVIGQRGHQCSLGLGCGASQQGQHGAGPIGLRQR